MIINRILNTLLRSIAHIINLWATTFQNQKKDTSNCWNIESMKTLHGGKGTTIKKYLVRHDIYNNEIQSTNITNFFIQQQLAIHCQVHLSFILLGIAMNQYFIPYLYPICREIQILSPWSHQKTVGFLITLGGIKINQFAKVWLILEAKFGGDP